MKAKLEALYLDYKNNFLTVGAFADYYGFEDEYAARVIFIGRKLCLRY